MIKNELQRLYKNKLLLIVLIAIIFIPSIYAGIFLSSMWDPYGDLKKLPVAIVNLDKAVDYNGKKLDIGNSMEKSLLENQSMAFRKETQENAQEGLKNGTYYMVITIPENFSESATTLTDSKPQQMLLQYETNPGNNYISSKLSESAMKEIKSSITSEVTRTYAKAVFDQIAEVGNGLQQAAEGTGELINGEQKLLSGNETIQTNLQKLSDGTATLENGAVSLKQGIMDYTAGVGTLYDGLGTLSQGTVKLASGSADLQNGSRQLYDGMITMSDSINKSLTEENVKNMQTAESGLVTLNDGIQQLNIAVNGDGANSSGMDMSALTNAMTSVGESMTNAGSNLNNAAVTTVGMYAQSKDQADLGGCAGDIQAAYAKLAGVLQNPSLSQQQQLEAIKAAMDLLVNSANVTDQSTAMGKSLMAAGYIGAAGDNLKTAGATMSQVQAGDLSGSVMKLKESIAAISSASAQLLPASSQAITSLRSGMQQIQQGLNKTESRDGSSGLLEGMAKVNTGIETLNAGISGQGGLTEGGQKLVDGAGTLSANSDALIQGADQIGAGAGKLTDGADKLAEGSRQVSSGISDLQTGTIQLNDSLQSGADTIADSSVTDGTLDMFSEPVLLQESQITTVQNNGHAMAAYMMSVGLWVGCLAFCLMYPLTQYEGKVVNGLSWWGSKAIVSYPVAGVMAMALLFMLFVANGFRPENMPGTILVAVLASMSFMSIMYFFNVLLGKVGSFVMLIFMVLQLAGSAGTYPIEISGSLAQALHPYMPFSYTVEAFRNTIAGGRSVDQEWIFLLILAVIFTFLTIVVFEIRAKRMAQNKPVFYQWLEANGLA